MSTGSFELELQMHALDRASGVEGEPEIDPESENDFCVSEEEEQNDDMVEIGGDYFTYYVICTGTYIYPTIF